MQANPTQKLAIYHTKTITELSLKTVSCSLSRSRTHVLQIYKMGLFPSEQPLNDVHY